MRLKPRICTPIVTGNGPSLPTLFYNPRPDLLKIHLRNLMLYLLGRLLGEDREIFLEIEKRLHEWVPTVESIILKRGPDEEKTSPVAKWRLLKCLMVQIIGIPHIRRSC